MPFMTREEWTVTKKVNPSNKSEKCELKPFIIFLRIRIFSTMFL